MRIRLVPRVLGCVALVAGLALPAEVTPGAAAKPPAGKGAGKAKGGGAGYDDGYGGLTPEQLQWLAAYYGYYPVLPQSSEPPGRSRPKGNNGVGNGIDPPPPGNPRVNDGPGTGPGNPGNKGGPKARAGGARPGRGR